MRTVGRAAHPAWHCHWHMHRLVLHCHELVRRNRELSATMRLRTYYTTVKTPRNLHKSLGLLLLISTKYIAPNELCQHCQHFEVRLRHRQPATNSKSIEFNKLQNNLSFNTAMTALSRLQPGLMGASMYGLLVLVVVINIAHHIILVSSSVVTKICVFVFV